MLSKLPAVLKPPLWSVPKDASTMPVRWNRPAETDVVDATSSKGTLAGEQLKRLNEHLGRASQAFDVTIRKLPRPIGRQHLQVSRGRNVKFHEWSQLDHGCYLLRTNLTGGFRTTVRLRHATESEAEPKTLLERLGLALPRRLKRADRPVQME